MKQKNNFYPQKLYLSILPKKNNILKIRQTHYFTEGARSAICLFLSSNPSKGPVLVPAYNCGKEVEAIIAAGYEIVSYNINRDFSVDIELLESLIIKVKPSFILVTNFFGKQDKNIDKIITIFNKYKVGIIEDCAHCYFGDNNGKHFGDVSIYSLRKFYARNDLGLLIFNNDKYQFKKNSKKYLDKNIKFGPLRKQYRLSRNYVQILLFLLANNELISRVRRDNYLNLCAKFSTYKEYDPKQTPFCYYLLNNNRTTDLYSKYNAIDFWDRFHPSINWSEYPDSVWLKNNVKIITVNQDRLRTYN